MTPKTTSLLTLTPKTTSLPRSTLSDKPAELFPYVAGQHVEFVVVASRDATAASTTAFSVVLWIVELLIRLIKAPARSNRRLSSIVISMDLASLLADFPLARQAGSQAGDGRWK